MLGLRLVPTDRFVARPRLLERLPDASGFVVALEAPYGFGKSVLATQWGARLERDGWRTVWLALAGQDPRRALAREFALPAAAPWGVVLDALWDVPTLLVLEDLEGSEPLEPLLKRVEGLLALSSRGPLPYPALLPWLTAGRLVRVGASELGFDEDEARLLFADPEQAAVAWRTTGGWPLPLHFAALTGQSPDRRVLGEGLRASVSDDAWHEALLVAALDLLPREHATEATRSLAAGGFVQALGAGYRLHPLLTETVVEHHASEIRAAVVARAQRLPRPLRGRAYERAYHRDGLRRLLDDPFDETYRTHPDDYLRWHRLVGGEPSDVRRAQAAVARLLVGDQEAGIAEARGLVANDDVALVWRVRAAAAAIYALAEAERVDEARVLVAFAQEHAEALPPFDAARLAQTLLVFAFRDGDIEAVERHVAEARAALALAVDDPRYAEAVAILTGNVAHLRWLTSGEADRHRLAIAEVLEAAERAGTGATSGGRPTDLTLVRLVTLLAQLHALFGDDAAVRSLAQRWHGRVAGPDAWTLEAHVAWLDGDLARLERVLSEARRWERPDAVDRFAATVLRLLRRRGDVDAVAKRRRTLTPGPYTRLELAVFDAEQGSRREAEAALEGLAGATDRDLLLAWHGAAYRVFHDPAHLDAIRCLSDAGDAALRLAGLDLGDLPRDRPELARVYPLEEVLASGWVEAVALRESELPPLQLRLLGAVEAKVLGRPVDLTERQRQLLAMIALDHGRDVIGTALWPEADNAKVRNNLNVQLSGLRRALQPWGLPTYLADTTLRHVCSDLAELEAALGAGDWSRVAERYDGRLAAGLDVPLLSEAADAIETRVLEGLRQAAAEAPPETAVVLLDSVLKIDQWHAEAFHDLLVALLRLGRRHDARRRYRRWAERWGAEFDAPVPDATRRLIDAP